MQLRVVDTLLKISKYGFNTPNTFLILDSVINKVKEFL